MDISLTQGFTKKVCGSCGVIFFISEELEKECLATGQAWTCPNGHRRSYVESEAAKYKRLYEAEKAEKARAKQYHINAITVIQDLEKKVEKLQAKKKKVSRKGK